MKKFLRVLAISVYALFFGFPLYWVVTMSVRYRVMDEHGNNPTTKRVEASMSIGDRACTSGEAEPRCNAGRNQNGVVVPAQAAQR